MDDQIERRIWNAIEKVALLNKESDEREATWLRHVLTLAGGALALLAALRQPEPLEGPRPGFFGGDVGVSRIGRNEWSCCNIQVCISGQRNRKDIWKAYLKKY